MENASKALLIAGAILLVIAIIAIGMAILNQGQDVTNRISGEFDVLVVNAHNSKFTPYVGTRISGRQVIELLGIIGSSNTQAEETYGAANAFTVTPTGITTAAAVTNLTALYTVTVSMTNGIITGVNIIANP